MTDQDDAELRERIRRRVAPPPSGRGSRIAGGGIIALLLLAGLIAILAPNEVRSIFGSRTSESADMQSTAAFAEVGISTEIPVAERPRRRRRSRPCPRRNRSAS